MTSKLKCFLLFLLLELLCATVSPVPTDVRVEKSIVFTIFLDVNGTIHQYRIQENIRVIASDKWKNLTLVSYIPRIKENTLSITSGKEPEKVVCNQSKCALYWYNVSDKFETSFTAELRGNDSIFHIQGVIEGGEFQQELYTIKNIEENSLLNMKLFISYFPRDIRRVNNASVFLPLYLIIALPVPHRYIKVSETIPSPNATLSQEENTIYYWNMVFSKNVTLKATMEVVDMGPWKSVWLPPIGIEVYEKPKEVLAKLNEEQLKKMYNETYSAYNETLNFYNTVDSFERNLSDFASAVKTIGEVEIKASKELESSASKVINLLDKFGALFEEETLEKAINSTLREINSTIATLNEIERSFEKMNYTNINQTLTAIKEAKRALVTARDLLSSVNVDKIREGYQKLKANANRMINAARLLKNAGRMHLKIYEELEDEYLSLLRSKKNELEQYLRELKDKLDYLNETLLKVESLRDIANSRLKELMKSVKVMYRDREIPADKAVDVKYSISIKMPLIVSSVNFMEPAKPKENRKEGKDLVNYVETLMIFLLVLVPVTLFIVYRLHKRKKSPSRIIGKEEIKKFEQEIENMLDEVKAKVEEFRSA